MSRETSRTTGRPWHVALRLVLLFCALAPCFAVSQSYPSKPIRLVVPAIPGSAFDTLGRLLASKMGEALGQPVVPENRGGAGGSIGVDAAAHAAPDGYTLLWANPGAVVLTSFTIRNLSFEPLKDLSPISVVSRPVTVLVVHPRIPVSSAGELVALARRNPGKLSFGSAGIGSEFHLLGELLKQVAEVDIVHVPYKGPPQALNDMMAGRIEMTFITLGTAMPQQRAGKLRILGTITAKRFPGAPDLPTVTESVPGYDPPRSWFAMMGPGGLGKPVVSRLHAEVVNALKSADMRTWLETNFHEGIGSTPEEFALLLKRDVEKSAQLAKAAGLKPE